MYFLNIACSFVLSLPREGKGIKRGGGTMSKYSSIDASSVKPAYFNTIQWEKFR